MCKKKKYLILDCETATIPLADYITKEEAENIPPDIKSKISTCKPLIYDLAWLICDRNGEIYKRENHIIPEIFYNMHLFNTAYYKEKRPIYEKAIENNEFEITPFNKVLLKLIEDCKSVEYVTAYNVMFDFKKAIPFTQKYLKNQNNKFYYDVQKESIYHIINKEKSNYKNTAYNNAVFEINGFQFPIIDIWAEACEKLLNNNRYKEYCIKTMTENKKYFPTNAEIVTRYITSNNDFKESHTALQDCEIEKNILIKCINRKAITYREKIKAFPFQELGTIKNFKKN